MSDDAAPREDVHKDEETAPDAPATDAPPTDTPAGAVAAKFEGSVAHESHTQAVVYVDRAAWRDVATFLRDDERFTQCIDVTAVDHLLDAERVTIPGVTFERYEVVGNFLSHPRNERLRVICEVPAGDTTVASITDVYPSVNFAEREVFDMFGITFDGHPDLTRILMPDDWVGHPLRKDDAAGRVPVKFKDNPGPR